jgi:hypothetical protein
VLSGLGNSDPRGAEGFQGGFLVIIRENPNQPASRLLLIVLIFSGDHADGAQAWIAHCTSSSSFRPERIKMAILFMFHT